MSTMKKLFIFIVTILNLLILLTINSQAQNSASLYGVTINVPINFEPIKTNNKKFLLWERMSYGQSEYDAKTIIDKEMSYLNYSDNNEVMFLGNSNFAKLFRKQKELESYHLWVTHFNTVMSHCSNKSTQKALTNCAMEKMGGNLSFTVNVADIKTPTIDDEISEFYNLNKSDMRKYINDSLKLDKLPGLKRKLKKFNIVYDNNENIGILVDLKFKVGHITSFNRSIITVKDDRLVMVQMNCMKKKSCDLGKSMFPNVIKPLIELNEKKKISLKNNSISEKDFEKLIGVVRTSYKIRSMSKLLLLLL